MTMQADSHLLRPADLEDAEFPRVRNGYDPGLVRDFLTLVGATLERHQRDSAQLTTQLHQEADRAWQYHELLRDGSINGDAVFSRDAQIRATMFRSAARAQGEKYIRDVNAAIARWTADAEQHCLVIVEEARREAGMIVERAREDIRAQASAAAEAARAAAPGPDGQTPAEAAAEARAATWEAAGPALILQICDAITGAVRDYQEHLAQPGTAAGKEPPQ